MAEISPVELAESWDNVGLLLGDSRSPLKGGVLLTIDLNEVVAEEAVRKKVGAVVAYHPPIFAALKRITAGSPRGRAVLRLMGAGVAVYSPHTAIDAAVGGVTEWLLGIAAPGAANVRAVRAHAGGAGGSSSGGEFKVTVFVPTDPPGVIDEVREAMSGAGAGVIGKYASCSFAVPGVGTFFGEEGAAPAVGEAGRLEHVTELRLEMVCPARRLDAVVAAMRGVHPYEEPAFDVVKLEGRLDARVGAGRIGEVDGGVTAEEVAKRLRAGLLVRGVAPASVVVAMPTEMEGERVNKVAVVPGSGGELVGDAVALGCGLFVTGEMKHHEVLAALDMNCGVVLAGHTETERGYLPVLAERLGEKGIRCVVSEEDGPPLRGG